MMRTESQIDYFERRAREERDAADRAHDQRARQSHAELADRYTSAASDSVSGMMGRIEERYAASTSLPSDFRILP